MKKLILAFALLVTSTSSFAITCEQYMNMPQDKAAAYVKQQVIKSAHGQKTSINEFTQSQLIMTGYVLFCESN